MTRSHPVLYLGAVFSSLVLIPAVGISSDTLEEIIVTADFRERAARELPASITVLTADQFEQYTIQHFEELINVVPNLNWSGDGHRARYLQIRGVGELEQYQGAPNPSVGFLIDDIDFSGIGTVATLFDVQRIEVLRGPQGTRYGANALAGLVYMQSSMPTAAWGGRVRLTAGDDDTLSGGIAVGGPLTSDARLTFRASVHHYESNGFRDNAFLGRDDTNERNETTVRGRLRWEPNDAWAVNFAALFSDIDDGYDAFAIDNSYTMLSDKPGRDAQESAGASLKITWFGLDHATLTSITAVADSEIEFSFDADWGNAAGWAPFIYDFVSLSNRERRTISQELRLASTDSGRIFDGTTEWVFGFYAQHLEDDLSAINRGDYYDPFSDFSFSLDETFGSEYEATNLAVFGQLDHALSVTTRVSFGLRIERRQTGYSDTAGLQAGPTETMSGGELTLSHAHSDTLSSFVSISKGYKAGGFNLGIVPDGRREFGEEQLWNIETGIKSSWLQNRLKASVSLFFNRRNNQQVRTSFQLVPNDPASFVFFTDNAAKGKTFGFESDVRWFIKEAWELYAIVGLLDATFDEFVTPQVDLSGRDQAHAPGYTFASGASYRHAGGFFARVDVSARDAFYFDVSHDQKSKAYALVNARVGFDAGGWTAQIWARNLFDRDYAVRGFFFGNEPPDFPGTLYTRFGDPRQVGVTLEKKF